MQHWMRMMLFSTDYSGVDTPRWCFLAVFRVLSQAFSTTDERVAFIRSCDRGSKQSDVLTSIGQEHNTCHQGDMLSRLPMEARQMIRSAMPDGDAPLDERVKANHWIEQWLMDNRQWVFSKEAKFKCKVHGEDCYAHPCMYLRADQPLNSKHRPMLLNVAGVTCVAWSAEGAREGDGHESCVWNSCWLAERVLLAEQLAEDAAFFECTALYPIQRKLVDPLCQTHEVVWLRTNPIWMGYPSVRHRVLGVVMNNRTTRWVGPDTQEERELDFARCFNRDFVLPGCVFLCTSEDERWEHYHKMAKARNSVLTLDELKMLDPLDFLIEIGPPGLPQRAREWREYHQTIGGLPGYLADLDHHPGLGNKASYFQGVQPFPLQLTHGMVAEVGTGKGPDISRIATPWEHFIAHGFHMTSEVCHDNDKCPLRQTLNSFNFKDAELKALAGNGMSMITQTAFMLWCLSYIERVDPTVDQSCDEDSVGGDDWD